MKALQNFLWASSQVSETGYTLDVHIFHGQVPISLSACLYVSVRWSWVHCKKSVPPQWILFCTSCYQFGNQKYRLSLSFETWRLVRQYVWCFGGFSVHVQDGYQLGKRQHSLFCRGGDSIQAAVDEWEGKKDVTSQSPDRTELGTYNYGFYLYKKINNFLYLDRFFPRGPKPAYLEMLTATFSKRPQIDVEDKIWQSASASWVCCGVQRLSIYSKGWFDTLYLGIAKDRDPFGGHRIVLQRSMKQYTLNWRLASWTLTFSTL